jgi:SAM-dependent methyltransferase
LNLELEHTQGRRRRKAEDTRAMSYLLDKVSAELNERVHQQRAQSGRWLVVDSVDSILNLPARDVTRRSVLDGDPLELVSGISTAQFEVALVNLQLAWMDYEMAFNTLRRLLVPGGKLFFSTFGPDTLFQLREAWSRQDDLPHVHDFPDLHLLGDQLLRSGFKRPILDADWLGVEFEDVDLLMEDLRSEGFHNVHRQRRHTLTGKNRVDAMRQHFSKDAGPAQITFELIYGYAEVAEAPNPGIRVNVPEI